MAKSKKRRRLEDGGLLNPKARLSKEQSAALETLTPDEVEAVISARNKLNKTFNLPGNVSSGSQEANKIPTAD